MVYDTVTSAPLASRQIRDNTGAVVGPDVIKIPLFIGLLTPEAKTFALL
jgi:hypothetical protein